MALNHAINLGIVITAVAACLTPALCSVSDCSSRVARVDGYEKCFNDRNLHAPDVFSRYRTAATDITYELPMADLYQNYGHEFCTNSSTELQGAVHCCYQIDTDCAPDDAKWNVPSPENMLKVVLIFCRNLQNMNFSCSERNLEAVEKCTVSRADQLTDVDTLHKLRCETLPFMAQCFKKVYKVCGCTTARVYSDIIYDLLMPATCEKDSNRVICDVTDPDLFLNDGLGNGSSKVASLFLGLVLALAILVSAGL